MLVPNGLFAEKRGLDNNYLEGFYCLNLKTEEMVSDWDTLQNLGLIWNHI